ncbi:MAG: aldehyde dehydrogenase family protein [Cyanobacteria bacterium HKST-UBA03]|nr:aldehyde dehydrogenase family protein [Cyanobacteria bacterium HKST-UBA03]
MTTTTTHLHYIDGQWQPAQSGATTPNRNPADPADLIGLAAAGDSADVAMAVAAATSAYPAWRNIPAPRRGEILFRAAQLLQARQDTLAEEMTREMGKVAHEARIDIQKAIDMLRLMAGEGRRLHGQTTPSELPDKHCMTVRTPLGVVACITPFNFPVAAPVWKIAPALVCGNTVVFKPAEDTPLMAQRLVEILAEAGLPNGVLNLVHGSGLAAGEPLASHPDVALVAFTGSCQTGRRINTLCAPTFKRVSLQLGGKNASIVLADADLDRAADCIVKAAFAQTGQICTATSRVVVDKRVHAALRDKLLARMAAVQPGRTMGPLVSKAAMQRVLQAIEQGQQEGATLLYGGRRETVAGTGKEPGWFVQPTLFDHVTPAMRLAQDELFGPVVGLMVADGFQDAMAMANGTAQGLSVAVHTRCINTVFAALEALEAGMVYVNLPSFGAEVPLPFGGTKASGNGQREGGTACLDTFSAWKTCYVDFSDRLQRAQLEA